MGSLYARAPHIEADLPSGGGALEGVSKLARWQGMSGSDLSCLPCREGSRPNCTVPGAGSRTGENPPYGILGRAAENVATGAGLRPTAKAVDPPPDPTGWRVSALPDSEAPAGRPGRGKQGEHIEAPQPVHGTRSDRLGAPSGMANLSAEEPDALTHARPGPWEPWRVTARATQPEARNAPAVPQRPHLT